MMKLLLNELYTLHFDDYAFNKAKTLVSFILLFVLLFFSGCGTNEDTTDAVLKEYPDCFAALDTTNLESGMGCASKPVFMYKSFEEGVLTISIDPDKDSVSQTCNTYDADKMDIYLEIYLTKDVPKDSVRTIDFCSCMKFSNAQKRVRIKATKGTLTASVKPDVNGVLTGERITARLDHVEFKHPITGALIKFNTVLFWNIPIGWIAG
ncbi:MAG: hypothetical protein H7259_00500 [Cytophagales bacterium]|nr:hypothetical protein [Cytophaga sp.]